MEAILFLMVIAGGVMLAKTRGRLSQLEQRLGRIEKDLRAGAVPVSEAALPAAPGAATPGAAAAGVAAAESAPEPTEPAPLRRQGPQSAAEEPPAEVAAAPLREVQSSLPRSLPSQGSGAAAMASRASEVPPAAPAPRPSRVSINFEELFGRKLPIWAGGITLAIAGVLIVKYAIDIGLFARIFTPGVQALCGLLFGFGLIGGAELAHRKRERVDDPRVAQALSGAGISTLYAALLVAAEAYQLISPLTAFFGMAAVTALALGLSLRHGAPSALLGLAGGLAAPALTVGITANVPMLAVYLALTIAGLVGVSRAQRWPWLALVALVGGAGWSLWLILAGEALTVLGSLSLGMFVVLLALAAPLFAFEGARSALLRSVAAVVGAVQLALLVTLGGFAILDWSLFALIAAASQWLAWRDEGFAVVPTIGAVLSILLLLIWPQPEPGWLLTIGLALAAIHALPLLARLWRDPPRVQRAVELSAIAVAAPIVALRHVHAPWGEADGIAALTSLAAALLPVAAAALGWKVEGRRADARFAWLTASAAGLLVTAAWFAVPHWQAPLFAAAVAAAVLWLAQPAGDPRVERVAAGYGLLAVFLLLATVRNFSELEALALGAPSSLDALSALRWAGLAAMAAFFAWRAGQRAIRDGGGFLSALLAYGTAAQLLPLTALPLAAPLAGLALAAAARATDWSRLRGAMLALAGLVAAWALVPLAAWAVGAFRSLAGLPMTLDSADLAMAEVVRRLFLPAVLIAASLRLLRDRIPARAAKAGAMLAAVAGLVAVHCFYRAGFAALFGSDFVRTGLAERLLWNALFVAAGYGLWRRASGTPAARAAPVLVALAALHAAWYSLLLHNPLWSGQAVGPVPLANLLLPLFAVVPLCLWLLGRMAPAAARFTDAALQPVIMVMVALFAWASLRQAFHGSLLAEPGLGSVEDILRSILGIVLAVGFLLWGIRQGRHDWRIASLVLMLAAVAKVFLFDASGLEGLLRIASFVALGFSLIGIGWLYSRQLRGEAQRA